MLHLFVNKCHYTLQVCANPAQPSPAQPSPVHPTHPVPSRLISALPSASLHLVAARLCQHWALSSIRAEQTTHKYSHLPSKQPFSRSASKLPAVPSASNSVPQLHSTKLLQSHHLAHFQSQNTQHTFPGRSKPALKSSNDFHRRQLATIIKGFLKNLKKQ